HRAGGADYPIARAVAGRVLGRHLNSCRSIRARLFVLLDMASEPRLSGAAVSLHQRYLVVAHVLAFPGRSSPLSVGPKLPAPGGRIQCRLEQLVELEGEPRVFDLSHHLDTTVEIAVHHVGAA